MEIKREEKVTVEEMGTGSAAAGQESDTREVTLAKANPKSLPAGMD